MCRQNKLKEELDKLRAENRRLALENVYLKERANTLKVELYNTRLEISNMTLNNALMASIERTPRVVKINDKEFTELQGDKSK